MTMIQRLQAKSYDDWVRILSHVVKPSVFMETIFDVGTEIKHYKNYFNKLVCPLFSFWLQLWNLISSNLAHFTAESPPTSLVSINLDFVLLMQPCKCQSLLLMPCAAPQGNLIFTLRMVELCIQWSASVMLKIIWPSCWSCSDQDVESLRLA